MSGDCICIAERDTILDAARVRRLRRGDLPLNDDTAAPIAGSTTIMSSFIIGMILAQGGQNTAEAPDGGIGAALIVLVGVIAAFALLFLVIARATRASRGGVRPAPGEFSQGDPPLEGLHRRR